MKYPPNESNSSRPSGALNSPEYDVQGKAKQERDAKWQATDFHKLNKELGGDDRRILQYRTLTDNLIDVLTPFMIFFMMMSVVGFLLDVRFIFSEEEHMYIRLVALCLIVGVVALNRLIASDGAAESVLYIVGLAGVTAIFTFVTTGYVGSVARGFMDGPYAATFFNVTVVVIIWWVTNRLMHECSVDENQTAGDVGILTGTLRDFKKASAEKPIANPYEKKTLGEKIFIPKKKNDTRWDVDTVVAVDPCEWVDPRKVKKKEEKVYEDPSKRLSKRHPGISILYFATIVMVIFALGLPVLRAGGELYELRGHLYVGAYTTAALFLLLLTSLGGLRQYFRSRDVYFPTMIGVFWLGLGTFMVFAVLIGAMRAPMPDMPLMLNIGHHEKGFFEKDSTFSLERGAVTTLAKSVNESGVLDTIGNGVLLMFAFFFLYSLIRGVGGFAAWVGRHRAYFPNWVIDLFRWIDRLLERVVRMPSFPKAKRRLHIKKEISHSIHFNSNMRGEGESDRDQTTQYLAHAYDALCALAYDMGVPKKDDQTPYEFIASFPKELKGIKKDARMLTDLYVRAAYSEQPLDKRTLDKVRQFWVSFEGIRRRYVR